MQIHYPDNLPVIAHRHEIIELLGKHQVIIVEGDTGSGKTTQIPKFCLEQALDDTRLIGCTQPRRIAAITVAARVGEELGRHGDMVGYKIRFHDETSRSTRIKFMTDGVLLAETKSDPQLRRYRTVIIDEAHERSLNIDFLLGYLKRLLPSRPDLRVIVTSATIDTAAFSRHFGDAPVVRIAGRTYPVTIRYQPMEEDQTEEKEGYIEHAVRAIAELHHGEGPGDILAFLPTEKDIRLCCGILGDQLKQAVVLPIFGRLQAADQKKIFQNFRQRKIVVATNVAETSITVPGIRYVVDTGLARTSIYNARAKTIGLPVGKISRAACDQRKGRCGRIGPGVCVRLYAEEDYLGRPEYTLPEIQRSNLAEVILQMIALGLGDPATFPFIDPPHRSAIRDGYALLRELGAISDRNQLTAHGRIMAELPIDPCIARIIIEAADNNCLREIKIIASALAIQDPRIRPAEKEKDADAAHRLFAHPHSDFLALLNIWNLFHQVQDQIKSWSRLKKFCVTHYLSFQRMREWIDLHEQLSSLVERHGGFADNEHDASYDSIHKSLACGFLRNIAMKKKDRLYQGAGNRELMIFPGSHQFLKGGPWIVAASFLETTRLYALTVATIEPEWLEAIAGPLCTYSWSNPHWQKKSGRVMAEERVSLFGLPILAGRRVDFARRSVRNQAEAQAIFIESALLTGEITGDYPFLRHNLQLIEKWQDAEHRLRKRDLLCDETALRQFYLDRLPADVFDRSSLNRLLKVRQNQRFLMMTEDDIIRRRPADRELADFPATVTVGGYVLPVSYHFEPGSEKDGMTITVPADLAGSLAIHAFDWLVPGLLREKTAFLLKGLPKGLRKRLVPIAAAIDTILDEITAKSRGAYLPALEAAILKLFRFSVQRSEWPSPLPAHLQPRFAIVDPEGRELAVGRDLTLLLSPPDSEDSRHGPANLSPGDLATVEQWQGRTFTTWDFEGLPRSLTLQMPGHAVAGHLYPALVASGSTAVGIRFEAHPERARQMNDTGMLILYRLQFTDHSRSLKNFCTTALTGPSALWLTAHYPSRRDAVEGLFAWILREIFGPLDGSIPDRARFLATVARVRQEGLYARGQELCGKVMAILRHRREVQEQLQRLVALDSRRVVFTPEKLREIEGLIAAILPADFLAAIDGARLEDCNRHLSSLQIRLERLHNNPAKDEAKAAQIRPYQLHIEQLANLSPALLTEELQPMLNDYRTMVEEFRISLFSPEIKTRIVVSAKKLEQLRQAISRLC
jgi:ATP-dependent helicase HrpA